MFLLIYLISIPFVLIAAYRAADKEPEHMKERQLIIGVVASIIPILNTGLVVIGGLLNIHDRITGNREK